MLGEIISIYLLKNMKKAMKYMEYCKDLPSN